MSHACSLARAQREFGNDGRVVGRSSKSNPVRQTRALWFISWVSQRTQLILQAEVNDPLDVFYVSSKGQFLQICKLFCQLSNKWRNTDDHPWDLPQPSNRTHECLVKLCVLQICASVNGASHKNVKGSPSPLSLYRS